MNGLQSALKLEKTVKTEVLWATPTITLSIESPREFNKTLAEIVLAEEQSVLAKTRATPVAGIENGLTAHWLEYNVLNWQYPEIKIFRDFVLEGVREFLSMSGDLKDPGMTIQGISCWANVLRPGQFLGIHHHDPAFVSAHYTVQTGFEDNESKFEGSGNTIYFRPGFLDRSHGGEASGPTSPWDDDWQISRPAKAGRLLLFPSYVRHEVRPYFGSSERISIAMDVFLKKQNLPIYFGGPRWFIPK